MTKRDTRTVHHVKINITHRINKTKDKLSCHNSATKAVDKINHPFVVKTLSKSLE